MAVRVEVDGHVAVITLDRVEARNALGPEELKGLAAAWDRISDDDEIRVGLLTGSGEEAFCAGADLKSLASGSMAGFDPQLVPKAFLKNVPLAKPLVAAVNGHCIAGGLELLLGTDIRLAAPHATFALQEVRWGIFPFGAGAVKLARQLAYCHAMEILLLGERIGADEAARIGLVNRVVDAPRLHEDAMAVARRLARNGPLAVQAVKRVVQRTYALPTEEELAIELEEAMPVFTSEDFREGPRAFAERRDPVFRGR